MADSLESHFLFLSLFVSVCVSLSLAPLLGFFLSVSFSYDECVVPHQQGRPVSHHFAMGKFACALTVKLSVPTESSLNQATLMILGWVEMNFWHSIVFDAGHGSMGGWNEKF